LASSTPFTLLQAREIAAAAASHPQAERELLAAAASCSLKGLKERCRRVRARAGSAKEENQRYLAIYARRSFRHWNDDDGAFRGELTLTPDDGARLLAAIEKRANERFDEARKAGKQEPTTAYRADALVDLATRRTPGPAGPRGSAEICVHVDATALRRGHVADGEVCEIPGVGAVPVATAVSLLPEAFVKVVVTDGVAVSTVCHIGRTVPAHVRTALEVRDPRCVVPGCDVAVGLEIDHFDVAFAQGGRTSLANLARLCHFHHAQKTYRGFELRGGPGKWMWEPPPEFDNSKAPGGDAADDPVTNVSAARSRRRRDALFDTS
jgi:hypothetical protein